MINSTEYMRNYQRARRQRLKDRTLNIVLTDKKVTDYIKARSKETGQPMKEIIEQTFHSIMEPTEE